MSNNDFFGLEFGDPRLTVRCRKIAQEVGSNPALSFPRLARDWGWLKGLYRFFANPKVTREKNMAGHIRNTVERCFAAAEGLTVNVVVVQAINPPAGVEPLHWILLTSEAINSQGNCFPVLKYYQIRWLIEDFHKGLKTGCQIENRQLTTRAQLEKVLGLFSVMVAQILLLRFGANHKDILPEENVLSNIPIEILKNRFPRESGDLRPQTLLLLLARLGGFIGRKADGSPGWLTLMRGMYDLLLIEQGVIMG